MSTLTLRTAKGSALTFAELDNNFTQLNNTKIEQGGDLGTSPSLSTSLTTSSSTFALLNTGATTLNFGGAATALTIGATSGTLTLRNSTTTVNGTLGVNGGSLTTTNNTFDLLDTTATTVTFARAATALTMGATTGTTTIRNSLVVTGDFTVNGTTTTINSTITSVDDIVIELGATSSPSDATAAGGGMSLLGSTTKSITWGSTNGWTSTETLNLASGKEYRIAGTSVLTSTGLGSGIVSSSLTSVGTIGTGTWQGTSVGIAYGGTGAGTASAAFNNLSPATTLGDIIYASGTNTNTRLAGNTTSSKQFLTQTGNGTISAAPAWASIANADVPAIMTGKTVTGTFIPTLASTASTGTLSWNSSNAQQYHVTALAAALTISADSGTPTDAQRFIFRIKDNGTSRALTWTTGSTNSFRAVGVTLPTSTVVNKTVYVGCVYNAADSRWDIVAVSQEA